MKIINRLYIILLLILFSIDSFSQTDTSFWFVAPVVTASNNPSGLQPVRFIITTNSADAIVSIAQPANSAGFNDTTMLIKKNSSVYFVMDYSKIANKYSTYEGINGKNNRGFYIQSDVPISVVYEYANPSNSDLFSLKGTNALGTEFYTVFQNINYNQNLNWSEQAYSAFDIVASEDNTVVTITTTVEIVGYPTLTTFNVNLDKGETFTAIPSKITTPPNSWQTSDIYGRAGIDHLTGCRITTNGKKIAVTLKDDSMVSPLNNGFSDLSGDQLIPVSKLGTEYIVVKGLNISNQEKLCLVGTQNNDSIFINGLFYKKINKGQTELIDIISSYYHIRTKFPSLAMQLSGVSYEFAEAILPPLNECTGSSSVSFTRTSSYTFYLMLIVRDGAEGKFLINGKPTTLIEQPDFSSVPGTTNWKALLAGPFSTSLIPLNVPTIVSNTKDVFHLAILNGQNPYTAKMAYLSDFNKNKLTTYNSITGDSIFRGCFGDTVKLIAKGAVSYTWIPSDFLSDVYSATPSAFPKTPTVYTVNAIGACGTSATSKVSVYISAPIKATYSITPGEACSPVDIQYTAKFKGTKKINWNFGNNSTNWNYPDTVSFDTIFSKSYLNTTQLADNFQTRLIVTNKDNCSDTLQLPLTIYPRIIAGFTSSDTIGCNPLQVLFTNTSSGNTDTSRYSWEFGDKGSSIRVNPSHHFNNIGLNDTIFTVRLISTSPYFCKDTLTQNIHVSPINNVNFTVDTIKGCVNLSVKIKNLSSGVDTFFIDYGDGKDTVLNSFASLTHLYNNSGLIPDTFLIRIIGKNTQGCLDTLIRSIFVYPVANANYSIAPILGCDSIMIQFTNLSTGYNLNYQWDFGDNSNSSSFSPSHRYLNKDTGTINFISKLFVESSNFCRDTHSISIPVYPFIKAIFSVDTIVGCNPHPVQIFNNSTGAKNFLWKFGDNTQSNSSNDTIVHTFRNSSFVADSNYSIKLVISNSQGCKDSIEKMVSVYHSIKAGFNPDTIKSCHPATFHFNSTSQGESYYLWNFGDGSTSVQNDSASHLYNKNFLSIPDTFKVSLLVISENNNCSDQIDSFIILNPYNRAYYTISDFVDCTPFSNSFNNASIGQTNNYTWSIDGIVIGTAPSDTSDFINTFINNSDSIEYHIITLDAVNAQFCGSSFRDTIAVYPFVKAGFGLLPGNSGCHPFNITISDSSVFALEYEWNFGDSIQSNEKNPSHVFTNFLNGRDTSYTIRQIVKTDNCIDTAYKTVTVYAIPKSLFNLDNSVACPPFSVNIMNQSVTTGGSFYWDFGDGTKDTTISNTTFPHLYDNNDSSVKVFHLSMAVVNLNNCADTSSATIQIYPGVDAGFVSTDSIGCDPLYVKFFNRTKNARFYDWDFSNGFISSVKNPPQTFYNKTTKDTTYRIKLRATSSYGCWDTITKYVIVYPNPIPRFDATPADQMYVEFPNVHFINYTSNLSAWTYNWKFGDDSLSTTNAYEFDHEYHIWGKNNDLNRIYLKLTATNPMHPQCSEDTSMVIRIFPPRPEVTITASAINGCEPLTIDFSVKHRYADSIIWDFDDGSDLVRYKIVNGKIIGDSVISHTFEKFNNYNVNAKVVGDGGYYLDYSYIETYRKPIIIFDIDPKNLNLPYANIQCFNESLHATSYKWDFGDNSFSTEKEPLHSYSDTGNFTVKLIAYTDKNCKDSMVIDNMISVENARLEFPSAFKPNTSGSNGGRYDDTYDDFDIFAPAKKEGLQTDGYLFRIYDRWGEIIFETTDIYIGWDGYYDGKLCKQDVYIYIISGKYSNGQAFESKGTITLLR